MLSPPVPTSRSSSAVAIRDHLVSELRFVFRGSRIRDRARIARMLVHLHTRVGRLSRLTRSLPYGAQREFDLELTGGPSLRVRPDDVVIIYILGVGEYDLDLAPLGKVSSLLDLGANIGVASIRLAQRLGGIDRIVCVEPEPESFRLLEQNLERNLPRAKALRCAAVAEPGEYHLDGARRPGEVRVLREGGGVDVMTVNELLDANRLSSVDLMKIDIEGGEAQILARAGDWASRVGAIIGEVHPPLTVSAAIEQLRPFGFQPQPVPTGPIFGDIFFVTRG
jgi:FkbM family methyltransferase